MEPAGPVDAEDRVPVDVSGFHLGRRGVPGVGAAECSAHAEAALGEVERVPDRPPDTVVLPPAEVRLLHAALIDQVLDKATDWVVGQRGDEPGSQAEAPLQPARHVVLPAAFRNGEGPCRRNAAVAGVQAEHHLAQGDKVVPALPGGPELESAHRTAASAASARRLISSNRPAATRSCPQSQLAPQASTAGSLRYWPMVASLIPPVGMNRMSGYGAETERTKAGPPSDATGKTLTTRHPRLLARSISEGVATPGKKGRPISCAAATTGSLRPGATAKRAPARAAATACPASSTVPAPTISPGIWLASSMASLAHAVRYVISTQEMPPSARARQVAFTVRMSETVRTGSTRTRASHSVTWRSASADCVTGVTGPAIRRRPAGPSHARSQRRWRTGRGWRRPDRPACPSARLGSGQGSRRIDRGHPGARGCCQS